MNRRQFLQTSAAVGIGAALPIHQSAMAETPIDDRVLILVELKGGNDGLNTVVPYKDPSYRKLRPTIGFAGSKLHTIDEQTGLHPALKNVAKIFESGEVAVVEGVGYPKPNRSHFRSIEIWDCATDSNAYSSVGWVHDALNTKQANNDNPLAAITIGGNDEGPLMGLSPLDITNPNRLFQQASQLDVVSKPTTNAALAHVINTQNSAVNAVNDLKSRLRTGRSQFSFSKNPLGRQLQMAARLLDVGAPVQVIKVSLGGFDTHANQRPAHDRILSQLDSALNDFRVALKKIGRWNDTVVMTYSEFGRRAKENGSGGTDHGTAAPLFVFGGGVTGGRYGERPSLSALGKNGDLLFTTDFRSVVRTVSESTFGGVAPLVANYPRLSFFG